MEPLTAYGKEILGKGGGACWRHRQGRWMMYVGGRVPCSVWSVFRRVCAHQPGCAGWKLEEGDVSEWVWFNGVCTEKVVCVPGCHCVFTVLCVCTR